MVMILWKNRVANNNKTHLGLHTTGRDSSIGVATGRSGDGIPMGGRGDLPHPSRAVLGPALSLVPGLSRE